MITTEFVGVWTILTVTWPPVAISQSPLDMRKIILSPAAYCPSPCKSAPPLLTPSTFLPIVFNKLCEKILSPSICPSASLIALYDPAGRLIIRPCFIPSLHSARTEISIFETVIESPAICVIRTICSSDSSSNASNSPLDCPTRGPGRVISSANPSENTETVAASITTIATIIIVERTGETARDDESTVFLFIYPTTNLFVLTALTRQLSDRKRTDPARHINRKEITLTVTSADGSCSQQAERAA